MRGRNIISASMLFTAFLVVIASFASCNKVENDVTTVNFSVSAAVSPLTKTVYGDDGRGFQYVDWAANDQIRITCAQCDPKTTSDYTVTSAGHEGDADKGTITTDAPLTWGDGDHTFYAVYPSPATTGAASTINGNIVTGTIPAVQTYTSLTGTDAKVAVPDMKSQYMVAKTTVPEKTKPVELEFTPMTTALEFTIKNGFESESAMIVKNITLTSAAYALNGAFTIDLNSTGINNRSLCNTRATAASNGKVTIEFATPVTVEYGKTLNFTFFLNPGNGGATGINDITFAISGTNAGTSKDFTRSAKLEKEGAGVAFPTHKKTRIVGIMIPEQIEWDIEGTIVVTPWTEGVIKDITLAE